MKLNAIFVQFDQKRKKYPKIFKFLKTKNLFFSNKFSRRG